MKIGLSQANKSTIGKNAKKSRTYTIQDLPMKLPDGS